MVKRSEDRDAAWRDYTNTLAVRLRQLRADRNLSQEDVAYRAGLGRSMYQQLEKGEGRRGLAADPKLRTLVAISQALNVSVGLLLPDDPPDMTTH